MIRNIISSFFTRASVALINLGILLLCSNQLGSTIVGQISLLILNIAIIQIVVEIYTGSTLVYFIPQYKNTVIYKYGFIWIVLVSLLCNLIFYMFSIVANEWLIHVLFLSLILSLNAFHLIFLLGKEKIKMFNWLTFLQPSLLFCYLAFGIFIQHQLNAEVYLGALYFSSLITLCFSSIAILSTKSINQQANADFNFFKTIRNGFMNQLANLSHTLSNRLNYYLLGSSALVGVYASSTSLVESLWLISASISPLLLTHVANKRDHEMQAKLTLLLAKLCFLISLIGIMVLFLLPESVFVFLLGKDFSQSKTLMLYLSPGVLCISFSSIISHYFSGQGLQKIQLTANFSGLIIAFLTAWFFIHHFGVIGACYTASCSYATQALVLTFIFMKHSQFKMGDLFKFRSDIKLLWG